ncbi:MAG: sigma-70 family RNA polymerase sigma factor [Clostridia bacterium]|nr:sigma-70 family RNA polymerase sigma factor [Clostridia bacterium]
MKNGKDLEIEQMIEKYRTTVYGVALTHTRTKYDADDVFQDVFVALWKSRPRFRDSEHEKAWLIRTTLNLCKKHSNASIWKRAVPISEAENEQFIFSQGRENDVYVAIRQMTPKLRTVIYLYYFEEMSVREIGRLLHVREGTVRMQLTRGRDKLREMLKRV